MGSSRPGSPARPPGDGPDPVPAEGSPIFGSGEYARAPEDCDSALGGLLDGVDAILWEADAIPFELRVVSHGAEALLGHPVARWLERPEGWPDFLHPADREALVRLCDDCISDDQDRQLELRAVTANGEVRWVRNAVRVVRDEAGHPWRLRGVMIDVTGQKRAIEALELREARMRALLDGLDDVVFRADPRGAVSFLSAAWLGMTGRSPLESLGASLFDFVHADDRDRVQARFAAVGARRESRLHLEVRFSSQGGQGYRWVELAARPVIDAAGEVSALAGTIADVTERRRMQQRLHQSDRMASVGALAAGVAHELNSPLGVVVANLDPIAQLAAGLPRSDELEAALRDARAGAERVRKVVRDLRAFSHADDEEARGPVDVRRLLETSIASVRDRVRRRARLVTELGPVPPVDANEGRLGQVFVDLLLNAAHAIPEGSAERNEVTVATKSDLAGRVLVEFRDTGGGIAPEVLDRLFEPFTSTKPISEGTGLGLAICHGVVSGLGGELTVENHPGVGAVLRVTLPAARSRTPLLIRPPSTPAIRAKARLLVVDDEPMIGNTVRRALGKEFDVLTVTSAQEADALFRKGERFDLVLSDLMMPGMTGMELYDAVLKLSADLADRMVFMTGGAFTPRARAFLDGISNARLDKPFSVAALRKLVDEQLQRVRV